jgi:4-hydroxybenzoyl-CoA thioesterase
LVTSLFTVQRRIAWGECDPARIFYTPRAIDYAVEAIEAWYEAVLGLSWVELAYQYGLDVSFVYVDCDYRRPLVADQVAHLQVWVNRAEHSNVTFTVIGEGGDGTLFFQANLVACFVARENKASIPIPKKFRQQIERYQAQCGEVAATLSRGNRSGLKSERSAGGSGTDSPRSHPLPIDASIFSRQRRVLYGDCEPSGVIYTPRVFNYAIEAVEEWYVEVLGISWMDLVCKREEGAPFVSASCEFLSPMVPGQTITSAVWVIRSGGASVEFAVMGYDAKGVPCFDARLVACFIYQDGFKTMRIPEVFRTRIQAYQLGCEALEGKKTELA